ncbi:MAG: hypothetical protein WC889_09695 [Myxococcota bacterium]
MREHKNKEWLVGSTIVGPSCARDKMKDLTLNITAGGKARFALLVLLFLIIYSLCLFNMFTSRRPDYIFDIGILIFGSILVLQGLWAIYRIRIDHTGVMFYRIVGSKHMELDDLISIMDDRGIDSDPGVMIFKTRTYKVCIIKGFFTGTSELFDEIKKRNANVIINVGRYRTGESENIDRPK